MDLNETPKGMRTHIVICGRVNSGKSTLANALSGAQRSIVSEKAGTTTDPVFVNTELHPLGACCIVDTAGFDDPTSLGQLRWQKSLDALERADVIIIVSDGEGNFAKEREIARRAPQKTFFVLTKQAQEGTFSPYCEVRFQLNDKTSLDTIRKTVCSIAQKTADSSLCAHLVKAGDSVLLVTPQDSGAPKGRLILPQVSVIRDLLDLGATVSVVNENGVERALKTLAKAPDLIITDSQVFALVYALCPKQSKLTSFSALFARQKGDIDCYVKGAKKVDSLKDGDKIAILEACSHNAQDGDIARVKIPNLLRKIANVNVEVFSGSDMPQNPSEYALAVHCGGCMFNRTYVLSRISKFTDKNVAVTNYGILLAKLNGILDKIVY